MKKVKLIGLRGDILKETSYVECKIIKVAMAFYVVATACGREAYADKNHALTHESEGMIWVDINYLDYFE
jgi:hypothetical protein